jgi:tetratricopeptide (TPR) repeat protein
MSNKSETGKHKASVLLLAFLAVLISFFLLSSCGNIRNRNDLAGRMAELEGLEDGDSRIKELKNEIRTVDKQVENTIEPVRKKGTYWKLLGLKYMDHRMWGEASSAFQEAIAITPDYAVLHYNHGLCDGQLSLSAAGPQEREDLINRSEASYRRAIALDPRYTPAMYALATLLVFELNRPLEAGPVLEDFLDIERGNINGRFLLARVYLDAGRPADALAGGEYGS